jgi:hypothetical protein
MSNISAIASRRAGVGTVVHNVGGALKRWWVAYTVWRIERWAGAGGAAACGARAPSRADP